MIAPTCVHPCLGAPHVETFPSRGCTLCLDPDRGRYPGAGDTTGRHPAGHYVLQHPGKDDGDRPAVVWLWQPAGQLGLDVVVHQSLLSTLLTFAPRRAGEFRPTEPAGWRPLRPQAHPAARTTASPAANGARRH